MSFVDNIRLILAIGGGALIGFSIAPEKILVSLAGLTCLGLWTYLVFFYEENEVSE